MILTNQQEIIENMINEGMSLPEIEKAFNYDVIFFQSIKSKQFQKMIEIEEYREPVFYCSVATQVDWQNRITEQTFTFYELKKERQKNNLSNDEREKAKNLHSKREWL